MVKKTKKPKAIDQKLRVVVYAETVIVFTLPITVSACDSSFTTETARRRIRFAGI